MNNFQKNEEILKQYEQSFWQTDENLTKIFKDRGSIISTTPNENNFCIDKYSVGWLIIPIKEQVNDILHNWNVKDLPIVLGLWQTPTWIRLELVWWATKTDEEKETWLPFYYLYAKKMLEAEKPWKIVPVYSDLFTDAERSLLNTLKWKVAEEVNSEILELVRFHWLLKNTKDTYLSTVSFEDGTAVDMKDLAEKIAIKFNLNSERITTSRWEATKFKDVYTMVREAFGVITTENIQKVVDASNWKTTIKTLWELEEIGRNCSSSREVWESLWKTKEKEQAEGDKEKSFRNPSLAKWLQELSGELEEIAEK